MMEQVFCKDCKHSFRTFSNWMAHGSSSFAYSCRKAFKPEHTELDPVLGSKKIAAKYESCGVARIGNPKRDDRCGEAGRFWEPKDKKNLFKYMKHLGNVHG
jgi:hypothetical protein